ncbi:VOC family protein [uncultured Arthrobacter sp.]|uniref:VOC family protein n=1 Tax=uncultured Arthrobacter sp. TaxID=114050 RepID=UPI002631A75D|nr:VOC family protein [uncultured Arthrobacter sp.]
MPTVTGINHLALTVNDLALSTAFYERVLGFPPSGELSGDMLERRLFTLPDGTNLGLTQHARPTGETFTPFTPGMDHLGLGVDTRQELQAWADHLSALGVDHSGLVDASYGTAVSFRDPDGTALEIFLSA